MNNRAAQVNTQKKLFSHPGVKPLTNQSMFTFNGRIGRMQFLWVGLLSTLIATLAGVGATLLIPNNKVELALSISLPLVLLSVYIGFVAGVKRCHDLNHSGWLNLLTCVPIVNFFFMLYLLFAPSKFESNLVGELSSSIQTPTRENAQRKLNSLPQQGLGSSLLLEGPDTVTTATTQSQVPPVLPVNQSQGTNADPHEQFWAAALSEFEGSARRPGLWARSFALSKGDEAVAKAAYLHQRADELSQLFNAKLEEDLRQAEVNKIADSIAQSVAHLDEERRTYALLPKGVCPNCKVAVLPFSAHDCHKCQAIFGYSANWKVIPISESEQIDVLKAAFSAGKKVDIDDVIFLAKASSSDPAIAQIHNHYRDSLLHLAAKFDLPHEASLLIANGANAGALNVDGKRPFEVAENSEFRRILIEACAYPIT